MAAEQRHLAQAQGRHHRDRARRPQQWSAF